MRKIIFGLGISFISISLGLIIIFFLDILFFPVKPWPYTSGGGNAYIQLHKSLFWNQNIAHIQHFRTTFLGHIIWKYWIIPFNIGVSLVYLANDSPAENRKIYRVIDKTLPYSSVGVFVFHSLVYFVYALRYQKKFSSSSGPIYTYPLLEWFPVLFPILVVIPTILNYLLYKGLKSFRPIYLMFFVPIIFFEFFISFIVIVFLLWV
jgi:hypothetical protein